MNKNSKKEKNKKEEDIYVFGVNAKYIPKDHIWRKIFPNKFRRN